VRGGSIEHLGRGNLDDGVEGDRVWDDVFVGRAGARRAVQLDSPPAILHRDPMRVIGIAVVLILGVVLAHRE
jgi:hypothetical protein